MTEQTTFDEPSADRISRVVTDVEGMLPIVTRRPRKTVMGDAPARQASGVVVRGIPEGGENKLKLIVQRVKLTEEDGWVPTGDLKEMPTWGNGPASLWSGVVKPMPDNPDPDNPEVLTWGHIQPTWFCGGKECVGMLWPFWPVTTYGDDPVRSPRPT